MAKNIPTAAKVRYVAPDVARGIALLGIALANTVSAWLADPEAARAHEFGGTGAEQTLSEKILIVFQAMFVHVRGLPMFSVLLGVGIGMIATSLWRRGYTNRGARRVLLRRYGLLFLFGLLHMFLLFPSDIMTTYGLCGMICALLIGCSDRLLNIIAWVVLVLTASYPISGAVYLYFAGPDALGIDTSTFLMEPPASLTDHLNQALQMLAFQPFTVPGLIPLVLIGFVWGRKGVVGDVDKHATMLRAWVGVGAAVVLLVGLPWGLSAIGVLPTDWEIPLILFNQAFGVLTGPAILALVLLAMAPVQRRLNAGEPMPGWLVPFNALGKRSMSGYLAQSLLLVPLTWPILLNVGHDASMGGKMLIAAGVWFVTLVLAWLMERAGIPGPFEKLHRRLSYGRDGLPEQYQLTPREIERGPQKAIAGYKQRGKQPADPSPVPFPASADPSDPAVRGM